MWNKAPRLSLLATAAGDAITTAVPKIGFFFLILNDISTLYPTTRLSGKACFAFAFSTHFLRRSSLNSSMFLPKKIKIIAILAFPMKNEEILLQLLGLASKKLPPYWPKLDYSKILNNLFKKISHWGRKTKKKKAKEPNYFLCLQLSFILEQLVLHI